MLSVQGKPGARMEAAGAGEDVKMSKEQLTACSTAPFSSYTWPRSVPDLHPWCLSLLHHFLSSWLPPPPVLAPLLPPPHPSILPSSLCFGFSSQTAQRHREIPQTRAISGRDRSLRQSGKEITGLPSQTSLISTGLPLRPRLPIPSITSADDDLKREKLLGGTTESLLLVAGAAGWDRARRAAPIMPLCDLWTGCVHVQGGGSGV